MNTHRYATLCRAAAYMDLARDALLNAEAVLYDGSPMMAEMKKHAHHLRLEVGALENAIRAAELDEIYPSEEGDDANR